MRNLKVAVLACCMALGLSSCHSSSTTPPSTSGGAGIGPEGGTVTSADGAVSLVIPAGALTSTQQIAIVPDTNTCPQGIGSGYSFTPDGLQFSTPATVTFHYTSAALDSASPLVLGVGYEDNTGTWFGETGGSIDTVAQKVTLPVSHFSSRMLYLAADLTPHSVTMFTNASINFTVKATGVPVTDPTGPRVPLTPNTATVKWGIPSDGELDPVTFSTANYKAPATMPSNTVAISATLSANNGQSQLFLLSFVHVIAKNWRLTYSDSVGEDCSSAGAFTTFRLSSSGHIDFKLNDDFTATYTPWVPDASNGIHSPSICPSYTSIASNLSIAPGSDATVNSVTSNYDAKNKTLRLTLDARDVDLPAIDYDLIGGQHSHQPGDTRQLYTTVRVWDLSNLQPWTDYTGPADIEFEHRMWILTPQ